MDHRPGSDTAWNEKPGPLHHITCSAGRESYVVSGVGSVENAGGRRYRHRVNFRVMFGIWTMSMFILHGGVSRDADLPGAVNGKVVRRAGVM